MKNLKTVIFISSILFILSFFYFLPSILSTSFGKDLILKMKSDKKDIFSAEKFIFSWKGPQIIQGLYYSNENLEIKGENLEVHTPFLKFFNLTNLNEKNFLSSKTKAQLKNFSIAINYPSLPKATLFDLSGSVQTKKNEPLLLNLSGKTKNNESSGNFEITASCNKNNFSGSLHLISFPVVILGELFSNYISLSDLTKILGPEIDLTSSFKIENLQGPIELSLKSNNLQTNLSFNFLSDHITLNKPITATVNLTQELSNHFMKKLNPFLITDLKAKTPIQIKISDEGFYLPLPLNLKKLNINHVMIDLGQMKTKNGDNLSIILGMMKYQALLGLNEMNVWCSPLNLQIKDGVVYTARMDALLADTIHVCTWGTVDLLTEKVSMSLGLTSDALKKSFGITNLKDNFVMIIPVQGSTKKLKIDTKIAAGKIAALVASDKAKEQNNVIGKMFGLLKHVEDDQKKVPPAKRPFPWEKK
jgi:hypothetical protein